MKNFIFVHIPKAGGNSIIEALNLSTQDCYHRKPSSYSEKELHDSFKFSFTRNPWSRVVSAYFFLIDGGLNKEDELFGNFLKSLGGFDKFLTYLCNDIPVNYINSRGHNHTCIDEWLHFQPQTKRLDRPMDFIGKTENLQEDFNHVCTHIQYPIVSINQSNRSNHKFYQDYYNDDCKKLVSKKYESDIETYKYLF